MDKYDVNMPAFPQFKSNAYGVKIEGGLSRREYVAMGLLFAMFSRKGGTPGYEWILGTTDEFLNRLDETKPTLPIPETKKIEHHPV